MEPVAFQHSSVDAERERTPPRPLAGWISCLALWSQEGVGVGGSGSLCPLPPLASTPSISPRLTCETQGWEPQRCSVTKSRFIGT